MNMPKVTDLLNEAGISHRHLSPSAIRIDSIIDGASRPVVVYDIKTNQVTNMPAHRFMKDSHRIRLAGILKRCKFTNTH